MGILTPIGENIAVNADIEYARYRLDRSPAHLRNTVKKSWTRVGLGVMVSPTGSYYIVENFSSPDMQGAILSAADKRKIQIESVTEMNSIAPSTVKIVENSAMSIDLNNWYAGNNVSDTKGIS